MIVLGALENSRKYSSEPVLRGVIAEKFASPFLRNGDKQQRSCSWTTFRGGRGSQAGGCSEEGEYDLEPALALRQWLPDEPGEDHGGATKQIHPLHGAVLPGQRPDTAS